MKKKIRFLLSLFFFLVLTSLISYHVISDTRTIKLQELNVELEESLLDRLINFDMSDSVKEFLLPKAIYPRSLRLFCIILTSQKSYKAKTQVIFNAWASKCDDYRFITVVPPEIKNATSINHINQSIEFKYQNKLKFLQPANLVHDKYDELTTKMYFTFKDIYKRYNQFDWYLKADDDTFIFVDNLRNFLRKKNSSNPVTFGYNFKVIVEKGYHSGGGGYVLSKEALSRLGEKLTQNFKFCPNSGTEDVDIAKCLRKLGVYPGNSTDNSGKERFHPLSVMDHFNGDFPDWLHQYASNPIQKGLNCCSDTSISFHYMSTEKIQKLSSIVDDFKRKSLSHNLTFKHIIDNYN